MGSRRRLRRTLIVVSALLLLSLAGTVHAEDPADARRAWNEGRGDDAFRILRAFLLEDPTDPAQILDAARLASEMKDLELVERVQGRAELVAGDTPDPQLDLALGIAYLALGELRLVAGVPSPTLAFLFADAESIASQLVADHAGTELEQEGRMLLARTRQALGDVEAALDALGVQGTRAEMARLKAELQYERAVTKRLDESGRPTEEGGQDLRDALVVLAAAQDFDGRIKAAWAAHRLGELEDARAHYVAAWALDPASTYPLRGLQSLATGRPQLLLDSLGEVLAASPNDVAALDALAEAQLGVDATQALLTLQRRIAVDEEDPAGWMLGVRLFVSMKQWREARRHALRALELAPASKDAAGMLQQIAHTIRAEEPERAISIYEELLGLRSDDPLLWNNFGFLLREIVAPYTDVDARTGIQVLKDDAPPRALKLLQRCVEVYRHAVSLVPQDLDELTEIEVWVLAGVVNDCGLMLHYFQDVQEPHAAERLYLRALEMSGYGYMDAYHPNLRRLYAFVLPERAWSWYLAAREARWAQMREQRWPNGSFALVPDEAKREIAAEDARQLRARLAKALAEDAEEDDDPWPPEAPPQEE